MLSPKFAEYVLAAGLTRELAMWMTAMRISGIMGKGIIALDKQTVDELSGITGYSSRTVKAHMALLVDAGWADTDSGVVYLRSMNFIIQKAISRPIDYSSDFLRFRVAIPEDSNGWKAMIRNFKAFLYSAASSGAVKARSVVVKRGGKRKGRPSAILTPVLSSQTRRASQSPKFIAYVDGNQNTRGVEYFSPENLSVRFDGKRYNKHHSTISRYKKRSKENGWLDYKHCVHVVQTFKADYVCPELAMLVAETSLAKGFGLGRTRLENSPVAGYKNLVVQLTDEIIPLLTIKRGYKAFYRG